MRKSFPLILVIGLAMTVLALAVSGRRAYWLYTLIRSGQPAHDRLQQMNERIKAQFVEVFGQRKLLRSAKKHFLELLNAS